MNRPELLVTDHLPPSEPTEQKFEDVNLEFRGDFNSPKAQDNIQKKFQFKQEENEYDEEDSSSSHVQIE